jgi:hypothetical protein
MNIADLIHLLLPILALTVLIFGLNFQRSNYILITLWLSLITLLLSYRSSGGEILGSYFNYFHAATYSLNLLILLISILYLLLTGIGPLSRGLLRYSAGLLSAFLVTAAGLLMINVWVNAAFIENRLSNTPILQVATFNKPTYCDYKYVFYKINKEKQLQFMCPNHYGFLPAIGELKSAPAFVVRHLPASLRAKFQQST